MSSYLFCCFELFSKPHFCKYTYSLKLHLQQINHTDNPECNSNRNGGDSNPEACICHFGFCFRHCLFTEDNGCDSKEDFQTMEREMQRSKLPFLTPIPILILCSYSSYDTLLFGIYDSFKCS